VSDNNFVSRIHYAKEHKTANQELVAAQAANESASLLNSKYSCTLSSPMRVLLEQNLAGGFVHYLINGFLWRTQFNWRN